MSCLHRNYSGHYGEVVETTVKKVRGYLNMLVDEVRWSKRLNHYNHSPRDPFHVGHVGYDSLTSCPLAQWAVALGGLGGGGGVKDEAIQHCGGVVWCVHARILPMVTKPPISSCHVRAVPALCTHAPLI